MRCSTPNKGTQGREMNRKIRIASALALAGFLSASAPLAASAGTPLLSGYGGPGAGEQAIVGSTLLGGPRGGGSSGVSSSSGGSATPSLGGSGGRSSNGSTSTGSSGGASARTEGSSAGSSSAKRAEVGRSRGIGVDAVGAHIYPKSSVSGDSRPIGISSGDVLPIVGIGIALTLIGVFTVRFVRLQP
jgi:hypothetical protein